VNDTPKILATLSHPNDTDHAGHSEDPREKLT
jgi:hypothetical protein